MPPAVVAKRVAASSNITSLPANLLQPLAATSSDIAIPRKSPWWLSEPQYRSPMCSSGDTKSLSTMVLFGDSHAGMWFGALNDLAKRIHLRLLFFGRAACPFADVELSNPNAPSKIWDACDRWRAASIARINALQPELVVLAESSPDEMNPSLLEGRHLSPSSWRAGVAHTLRSIKVPTRSRIVLGNMPPRATGPSCLSVHTNDVQACSVSIKLQSSYFNLAEAQGTRTPGSTFVNTMPWLCKSVCAAVVDRFVVYFDPWHVTATYAQTLEGVLAKALSR